MRTEDRTPDPSSTTLTEPLAPAEGPAPTEPSTPTRRPQARIVVAGGVLAIVLAGGVATVTLGGDAAAPTPGQIDPGNSELSDAERSLRLHLDAAREARRAALERRDAERWTQNHDIRTQ